MKDTNLLFLHKKGMKTKKVLLKNVTLMAGMFCFIYPLNAWSQVVVGDGEVHEVVVINSGETINGDPNSINVLSGGVLKGVQNSGTLSPKQQAIHVRDGGSIIGNIENKGNGLITSDNLITSGIYLSGSNAMMQGSIINEENASIRGGYSGILIGEGATLEGLIDNRGLITGDTFGGIYIRGGQLEGIDDGNGSRLAISNTGTITGESAALTNLDTIVGNIRNSAEGKIEVTSNGSAITNAGGSTIDGTIINEGSIKGIDAGIFNEGNIRDIDNKGTIKGDTYSINTESGIISGGINNYGTLDGNVNLGANSLSLLGTQSNLNVLGDISGNSDSTVNVGNGVLLTDFNSTGNVEVGKINVLQNGKLTLTNNSNWTVMSGNFTNDGIVAVDSKNGLSDVTVNVGTNFFINNNIIDLTGKNPKGENDLVGDKFTINGNYVSNGGSIYLNTLLDDATSNNGQGTSDLVVVTGDVTTGSGATNLYITPTASTANLGQLTTGNGIKVIDVQGTSSTDAFQLGRPVVAGAYEYTLGQGQTDESWYLSSYYKGNSNGNNTIQYNPAMGAYLANQTAAVQMFQQTLFDRLISSSDGKNNDASKSLFWMKTKMTHGSYDSIHGSLSNRTRSYTLQMGGDLNVWALNNGGYFHLGIMGGYGDFKDTSKSDTTGTKTDGKVKGYSTGIYGTYFANQDTNLGLYIDLWSQMGWYRNEVSGQAQIGTKKYNSTVWSNSVEAGYGIPLAVSGEYQWLATPQAQLTYNSYDTDNLHDKNNLRVTRNDASGLDTRLGVRFHARGIQKDLIEPFLEVNWLDTTAKNKLRFNGKSYKDGFAKDRFEAKVGLQGNINERWSVSAQMGGQWGNNSYNNYQGQLNVNYKF